MASYVYIKSEPQLWTVGFYDPSGKWQSESDHDSKEEAANRVAYLNGRSQFSDEDVEILKGATRVLTEDDFATLAYMIEIHRKTEL